MNVFEDLVDELKEENLLEDTFMDASARSDARSKFERSADDAVESESGDETHGSGVIEEGSIDEIQIEEIADGAVSEKTRSGEPGSFGLSNVAPPKGKKPEPEAAESADIQFQGIDETVEIRKPNNEQEFFKKRAASEISSLQMVEAILSSVEREQMKVVPNSYDALDAKKALHFFVQVADAAGSEEYKQAEFTLLRETEAWCSALAERDKNISVTHIRRYTENCKPMLSSQAMLAIARFYRNLPYSESVRGKFDFIITRLFSRPVDEEKRMLLFSGDEMLGHIKTLYADWSSIPLYSADENESNILLTALSFEELCVEAEGALSFDDLIRSDFFSRLRLFKESIAELFFAPVVTSAAIQCNVRVGNLYVDLLDKERHKSDSAGIHEKFSDIDDQTVSEAAGRTLELVKILRERGKKPLETIDVIIEDRHDEAAVNDEPTPDPAVETKKSKRSAEGTLAQRLWEQALGVNKIFLVAAVLLIAVSMGIYVWGNYLAEPRVSTAGVKTLSFQGTELGEMVKTAKLSGETLYIVSHPSLDTMNKESQMELLKKFYAAGNEKGWANVNLMNSDGRTVGYASRTRIEIITQ